MTEPKNKEEGILFRRIQLQITAQINHSCLVRMTLAEKQASISFQRSIQFLQFRPIVLRQIRRKSGPETQQWMHGKQELNAMVRRAEIVHTISDSVIWSGKRKDLILANVLNHILT